ncbi:MAG: hypothetical protein WC761_05560 [Candidatus Paceibacterota bacterium]
MTLEEAKQLVFREKPAFAELYKKYGNKSWLSYAKERFPKQTYYKDNKQELFNAFEKILLPLLGKEKTERAVNQLEKTGFVSTADHHGILCHPFFANTALLRSHSSLSDKDSVQITLSCGGISLSNSSFPRGIFYHDRDLKEVRLHFKSLSGRRRSVYGLPNVSEEAIKKSIDKARMQHLSVGAREKLLGFLEKIKNINHSLYSEQLTVINDILWENLFENKRGTLVYLEMESLVRELLLSIHLKKETIIQKIFLDPETRESYIKNFESLSCAHDTVKQKGSHLFWHIDNKAELRRQLFVKDNALVSPDEAIVIPLTKESLSQGLLNFELLPTLALSYSMLSFHYGLTLGGGFSQIQYLGEMRDAYEKVSGGRMTTPPTDIFTGEFVALTIGKKPAPLIDLLLWRNTDAGKIADKAIESVTVSESLDQMMPEFVDILGSKEEITNMKELKPILNPEKTLHKKEKCIYCGNNPTNHALSYFFQTILVPLTPLVRAVSYLPNRFIERIIEIVSIPYLWLFTTIRMWSFSNDPNDACTERSRVIWDEAMQRGIKMQQLKVFGKAVEQYRAKVNGRWRYFESIPLPPRFRGRSYAWMDDKWILKNFLESHGVPVAYGRSVSSDKEALETFREGRAPFIAKPRLGSRGRHTSTFLATESELLKGFRIAQTLGHFVIVEEQLFGSVYRGTYVDGEVVGILRGDPPRITGDGVHTIEDLIESKNKSKHEKVKDVLITPMLIEFLERQNLSLGTILPKGKTIDLSEKIGINYGGFAVEMLPETHPKILEYIKKAGDALNAPVIGFDFIIPDVTKDPDTLRWGIIEANSLPFINLHHFPIEGTPINVAGKVWDLWEEK